MARQMEKISTEMLDDLNYLSEIGSDNLEKIISTKANINNPDSFRKFLSTFLSDDDSGKLFRIVIKLYATIYDSSLKTEDFINNSIESIDSEKEDIYNKIEKVKEKIINLINLEFVKIVYDSMQVNFNSERILNDLDILTSIMPVFSKGNDKIISSVISHSLDINYYSKSRDVVRISLLIDRDDIEKIRAACDRALDRENLIKSNQSKFNI